MPALKYAFEKGAAPRVEISWTGIWKNIRVRLDGDELGGFSDQKELEEGKCFFLSEGHTLSVQLVQEYLGVELHVRFDGRPVPGSAGDPQRKLKNTSNFVYMLAGLNVLAGGLAVFLKVPFLLILGMGVGSLIFGGIFFILGFLIRRRSTVALVMMVFLFALDAVVVAVTASANGYPVPVGGLVARVAFLVPLLQGFRTIREVQSERTGSRRELQVPPALKLVRVGPIEAEKPLSGASPLNVPKAG